MANASINTVAREKVLPEKKIRAGAISATIWKNKSEANGKIVEYSTISLDRNYKDRDGKWQNTHSMRTSDLPKAQLVLSKAYEYLVIKDQDSDEIEVENIE
ncbi:hypothetical protein COV21_01000 [Candidatus Woesearchaeota archaeon CG10_big_fil_rev_8_21_14_0_10_45_5]|nr:MAG: hypothetical protein COV21_01000 [Candidatus Woesearchaeota archaeon CG10_big_fil_rev_8_21_14_0_10_45_5]PIU29971.1 MAG: hypothetical protein COT07_03160 [Candidatus Woesearchaeota archaeon CG07_land_8_20_14_0_80_44_23]